MEIKFYTIQEWRKKHPNNLNMSFKTSQGERLTKKQIDTLIRRCKEEFIRICEYSDTNYCEACGMTSAKLTCSHIISVNKCQNDGKTEFAYDTDNLQLECITCHLQTESGTIDHHANARYKKEFIDRYNNFEI